MQESKNERAFPVLIASVAAILTIGTGLVIVYGVQTHGHTHVPMLWIYFVGAIVLWALIEIGSWWRS